MSAMDQIERLRALDEDDADFPLVVAAMKSALANPIARSGTRYWMVDLSGSEAVDMVSVVDVLAIGNIAKGSADWPARAADIRLYDILDRHAVTDVLEAVISRLQAVRSESSAPSP